jgi:hypothetical protein
MGPMSAWNFPGGGSTPDPLVGYLVIANAQALARRECAKTSKVSDRASDRIAHEEVERIGI